MIETKFKDTEVGRIPEDWELDKLKDKFEFRSNNTLSRDALSESGTIQDVHYGDVLIKYGSHLDVQKDEVPYITDKNYKASVYISDGDVIVADTAEDETVGKATEVINVGHHQLVSGLHTMWLHPIVQERYALGYLGYAFNANVYHNQLLPLMQGTKVTSVSKTAVKDTSILVPPKSEQTRIAKALSIIDTLISELGNLIEKKRAIKQGAIQQLLSGKKRLKGFAEPWIEKKLGEIGVLTKQSVNPQMFPSTLFSEYSMPAFDNGQSPDFKYGNEMFSNRTVIDGETLLYNKLNVRQKRIWLVKECGQESICSAEFLAYKSNNINLDLLKYILSTNRVTKDFIDMSKGTSNSQKRIQPADFLDYSICYPKSGAEQKAIAFVLSSMDEEISALEVKQEKYTVIKQGMMQQLLTGKIRLID